MLGIINKILRLTKTINLRSAKDTVSRGYRMEGSPQPFDNMPFSVPNRYAATVFFSVFFGIGLWAPYIIVWYMMAKRTM